MAVPFRLACFIGGLCLLLLGCEAGPGPAPTAEAPRLLYVETLPPPSLTPLRFPTNTNTPTITVNRVVGTLVGMQAQGEFRLITPTPPFTPTPSHTATPRPTHTLTPSRTFTASRTPTPSATFTPSRTPHPSLTPEGSACPHLWFFVPAPANCPTDAPLRSDSVYQPMQGGTMLELQALGSIIVLYNDGGFPAWEAFPSVPGTRPLSLQAPAGLIPPQGSFATIWHGQARRRLGWGLASAQRYTTFTQVDAATQTRYLAGPQGELFALLADQSGW